MKSKLPEGYERDPVIRTNRGYWDGVADRQRGKRAIWANKCWISRQAHPFDAKYGEGYWIGFYDEPAPKGAIVALVPWQETSTEQGPGGELPGS